MSTIAPPERAKAIEELPILSGQLTLPENAAYDEARELWNAKVDKRKLTYEHKYL